MRLLAAIDEPHGHDSGWHGVRRRERVFVRRDHQRLGGSRRCGPVDRTGDSGEDGRDNGARSDSSHGNLPRMQPDNARSWGEERYARNSRLASLTDPQVLAARGAVIYFNPS